MTLIRSLSAGQKREVNLEMLAWLPAYLFNREHTLLLLQTNPLEVKFCPGSIQGQVGWGPGQPALLPDLEVGGPACGWGVGTSWSLATLPAQAILWFYEKDQFKPGWKLTETLAAPPTAFPLLPLLCEGTHIWALHKNFRDFGWDFCVSNHFDARDLCCWLKHSDMRIKGICNTMLI